jgi:hypothetical protein
MPPFAESPAARRLLVEPAPVARRGPLPEHLRAVMPVHLFDEYDDALTRCTLFGTYVLDRVTDDPAEVTCYHCLQEGPAAAHVVLPDGRVIERRSPLLDGYHFAVARPQAGTAGTEFRLAGWATDIADAREAREHQLQCRRAASILPVRFAEVGAR